MAKIHNELDILVTVPALPMQELDFALARVQMHPVPMFGSVSGNRLVTI
jgi:hypothetical protein